MLDIKKLDQLLEHDRPFAEAKYCGGLLRFGARLVDMGCITPDQLAQALKMQHSSGGRVGELPAECG